MGDWDTISERFQNIMQDAFKFVCPGVNIVLGSDLYDSRKEYWKEFVELYKTYVT